MAEKEKPYLKRTTKHSAPYVKEAQRAYNIKTTTGKEHASPGLKVIKSTAQNTAVILRNENNNNIQQHEEVEESLSIMDKEKELIIKALKKHRGKRKDASLDLGISERTLYRKLKEYDIDE